jgi:hypothetical protein
MAFLSQLIRLFMQQQFAQGQDSGHAQCLFNQPLWYNYLLSDYTSHTHAETSLSI